MYRSFDQFVLEAMKLWRPFDNLAQLPDYLIRALREQLTLSPMQVSKLHLQRLQKWRSRAKELAPLGEKLQQSMPTHVRKILLCKRTLLLQEMANEINWPDQGFFDELRQGFRLVGCLQPSGVFRPGVTAAALMAQSQSLRNLILDGISSGKAGARDVDLFEMTLKEAKEKSWLQGPRSPAEVSRMFKRWLPVRRFCVQQRGKLRAIDDFRDNLLNTACCVSEKIVLQAIDHVVWSLNVLCHFYRSRGAFDFVLSTGERLSRVVRPDWAQAGADLKASTQPS